MSPNEVHLADMDAVPVEEIACERCGKLIVTRWEQRVAAGQDFVNQTRLRVRILVPVRRALHLYNEHSVPGEFFELLRSNTLTPAERTWLRRVHHQLGNVRAHYKWRRKVARALGGPPGYAAERAVQEKYPNGIPARLTVYHTVLHCPEAMAIAREKMDRTMERINTLYEQTEGRCSMRDLITDALDRLEAEIKEEANA